MTADFLSTLEAHGLRPNVKDVIPDGKFYRCATDNKPKKRNGFFKLALDGRIGWFGDFATGLSAEWKVDGTNHSTLPLISQEEIARRKREQEALVRKAMVDMRKYWDRLRPLNEIPAYLDAHGLTMQGCGDARGDHGAIVIPMMRGGGLISLQTIYPDGSKLYWKDLPTKGAHLWLRRKGSTVTLLAEGYATALALFQSIPTASVLVAFHASNLLYLAEHETFSGMVAVCADNDHATAKKLLETTGVATNPGIEYGKKAAAAIGCNAVWPEGIEGSDWCDALKEWKSGMKVRMAVLKAVKFIPNLAIL